MKPCCKVLPKLHHYLLTNLHAFKGTSNLKFTTGKVRTPCSRFCRVLHRIRASTSTVFPSPISSARIPPGQSTPARGNSRIKLLVSSRELNNDLCTKLYAVVIIRLESPCTSIWTTVSVCFAPSRKRIIPSSVGIVKELFATNRDHFPPKKMQPLFCARNTNTVNKHWTLFTHWHTAKMMINICRTCLNLESCCFCTSLSSASSWPLGSDRVSARGWGPGAGHRNSAPLLRSDGGVWRDRTAPPRSDAPDQCHTPLHCPSPLPLIGNKKPLE